MTKKNGRIKSWIVSVVASIVTSLVVRKVVELLTGEKKTKK